MVSRASCARSSTSVWKKSQPPGSRWRAIVSTSSGCTTRRFLCRALNHGSGNWIETDCNGPQRDARKSTASRFTFALHGRKAALATPRRRASSAAASASAERISRPSTFADPLDSAARSRQKRPRAQPISTCRGRSGCVNAPSSGHRSGRSSGCMCTSLSGFTWCRIFFFLPSERPPWCCPKRDRVAPAVGDMLGESGAQSSGHPRGRQKSGQSSARDRAEARILKRVRVAGCLRG
mmetsp:Transcript_39961/g.129367  ORF Transcript_39961/g.129367 Transcript_39961/m.129367 type:complete len:236 (+) Transcript_39961:277-984(+)